jgi:hypothetical protein
LNGKDEKIMMRRAWLRKTERKITMKHNFMNLSSLLVAILFTGSSWSDSVSVGYAPARPGAAVEIAVAVNAGVDLGGVNLRLEYDPDVFVSAGVSPGPLLGVSHVLASHSPEPGRLNVVAYAPSGAPPFAGQAGTVFSITLQVSPSATPGMYPISFFTGGGPLLASSGLSDMNGTGIAHGSEPGTVDVRSALVCDIDSDGAVSEADLIILLQEWHEVSSVPLPKADINLDTTVNEEDMIIFQKDWKNPPPDRIPDTLR